MYKIKLSPYAKTFYYEWILDPDSYRYNITIDQSLYGPLDVDRLRNALKRYVSEHLVLNSHIEEVESEPHWVKNNELDELEYSEDPLDDTQLFQYVSRPFALNNGPLYRFLLVRLADDTHRFILVFHHIIIDVVSINAGLFGALSHYYNDINYVAEHSINHQIELLTSLENTLSNNIEQHELEYKNFWHDQLTDIEGVDFDFLKTENNTDDYIKKTNPIDQIKFSFCGKELENLSRIKKKYGITFYIYGLCIFALVISRHTSRKRLAISYPISIKEGIDILYGTQVNTNIIPYDINEKTTIVDLFNKTRTFFKSLKSNYIHYGYYPIWKIVKECNNKSLLNLSFTQANFRSAVFTFNGIHDVKTREELHIDSVEGLFFGEEKADEEIFYCVRYDKSTVNRELLNTFVNTYKRFFSEAVEDLLSESKKRLILDYCLVDTAQYQQIVYEFNQTDRNYPRDKTIHTLFEEQVLRTPDHTAVVYEDRAITYHELNQKANQLAHYLIVNCAIQPDDLVTLCLDRSELMIVAMLGVLKAGGAYVPIDPKYPGKRIAYILHQTHTKAVLTNKIHRDKLQRLIHKQSRNIDIFLLDANKTKAYLAKQADINPITFVNSTNLVYVIYTSGTTGYPKGVMIEHRSVVNYVAYLVSDNQLNIHSKASQYSSFYFDALVIEVYPILSSGGTLYIIKEEEKIDIEKVSYFFNKNSINYSFLPTRFASLFINKKSKWINLIIGGEKLGKCANQTYRVINAYGLTETTVQSNAFVVNKPYYNTPIGKPINNVKCYVVDCYRNILPIGIVGELIIGGEGLARGYLGDPELTAKKFVPNPFRTEEEKQLGKNERIYHTGDLVRLLPDGNLEYIGRNDAQVKIRGYRIELSEIEKQLLAYPPIRQAVVLAKQLDHTQPTKQLVGYYVSDSPLDHQTILDCLATHLPEYMVPHFLVHLTTLPLNHSGKLDRRALPNPLPEQVQGRAAPRTELESQIAEVYAQVLGLTTKQLGITDDLFKLGGDSIIAIQICSQLLDKLNLHLSPKDLFTHKTIKKLHDHILQNQPDSLKNLTSFSIPAIEPPLIDRTQNDPEQEIAYPANGLQQGLIYQALHANDQDRAYHIQLIGEYGYPLNPAQLRAAWEWAQKKYPGLRLRFEWEPELQQIVLPYGKLSWEYIDLSQVTDPASQIQDLLRQDQVQKHDLKLGDLLRIYLIKESNQKYTQIVSYHHILLDGWSVMLLLDRVNGLYLDLDTHPSPELKTTSVTDQHRSLDPLSHEWERVGEGVQQQLVEGPLPHPSPACGRGESIQIDISYEAAQAYLYAHSHRDAFWDTYLDSEDPILLDWSGLLKAEHKHTPLGQHPRMGEHRVQGFPLEGALYEHLKKVGAEQGLTLNALLQYAWHKTLSLYCNTPTTITGMVLSIRNMPIVGIAESVGLYVNTLPLIVHHTASTPIGAMLSDIQARILELDVHSSTPLSQLQKRGQRLFDHLFVYENFPIPSEKNQVLGFKSKSIQGTIDYPLAVIVYETERGLLFNLEYAGELFDENRIKDLLSTVHLILTQLAEPGTLLSNQLHYLTPAQAHQILYEWNDTDRPYPRDKTVHSLFEEQVLKTPDHTAVIYEDRVLTYRELNQKANQLAHYLIAHYGIQPDDLVALCLDRSEWMIVAILGVLKAGGAYVPMEPTCPEERAAYMLKQTGTRGILTKQTHQDKLQQLIQRQSLNIDVLALDNPQIQTSLAQQASTNPIVPATASTHLIYVIYTSGTTGHPKGVMMEHRSIVNYVLFLSAYNQLNHESRGSQYTRFTFDVSVLEVYPILLSGGALYIIKEEDRLDIVRLNSFFNQYRITDAFLPPRIAELFYLLKNESLIHLGVGGEKLENYVNQTYRVFNVYGPTETNQSTIFSVDQAYQNIPIGKPISNAKCYVVNHALSLLPPGSVGELMIGGECLARGYLEDPELTAQKFIPNPFQTEEEKRLGKNDRIYRTGDLVRQRPDGNLEYIGRNDFQVKIRGYRVELGEIEQRLAQYPGVKCAVALPRVHPGGPSRDQYLVAYYVTDGPLDEKDIKAHLARQLPDYMLPTAFVHLDRLPLTLNGKLNREALPDPGFKSSPLYVAPRNQQEQQICEAFSQVLGINKVGIDDDFFLLGGNSIRAIRLVSVLQNYFDIKIADVFDSHIPSQLAEHVRLDKDWLRKKLVRIKEHYPTKIGHKTIMRGVLS